MLTPSYLLHAVEPAEEIAEQLHSDILKRIIDRILLRLDRGDGYILTATDKWNIQTLQEAGYLLEDIQKEIAKATGLMRTEIKEAMEDAGVQALSYDDAIYKAAGLDPLPLVQSPYLIQLMQDTYEQTLGEWINFTSTTANAVQQTFIKLCDQAYMQVMSGSMGWTQATREAVEGLISEGVRITYPSGHSDTIETATARCVRTGVSQGSARIQIARMDEMDVDLVIVSSHLGARPEHAVWQGKVYSRKGKTDKYEDFVTATGYGSAAGLSGINCRHSFSPFFEGMSNPFTQYDSEENRKQYEAEQRQRAMERRIRKSKREVMGYREAMDNAQTDETKAALEAKYQKKAALLQQQNKAYNQYCEDTGLKKQSDRISIAKWDRSQAAKATAAAKKYNSGTVDHKSNTTTSKDVPHQSKIKTATVNTPIAESQRYTDVTQEWRDTATPNSNIVEDAQEVTVKGTTYKVDGHNVVLDYSPHEKEIAELLEKEFGGEIKMLPRVNNPQGVSTPDYLFRGEAYDLKTITGSGKKCLYDRISKKKNQSANFVFDLSGCELSYEKIVEQLNYIYKSSHTSFVDKIIMINDELNILVYKRT